MQTSQKLLFTKQEAAVILGVSVRTIESRIARGDIRAIHKGRLVRIHHAEMERWAKIDEACIPAEAHV